MKSKFIICLLCGFAAEGALRFLILPRMGWLPGLLFALAVTVLVLLFYLILTRGVPMAGERGRLLTYLWMALAAMMVAVQGEAGALLTAFLLLVVRCSNCGKHLPLFGDMDRCSACRTTFTA